MANKKTDVKTDAVSVTPIAVPAGFPSVINLGSRYSAYGDWSDYFHTALSGLTNTPVVAEWSAVVLVQKASDIADAALATETAKRTALGQ